MARSTRSQDALLAVVVLSTLFVVPALEVYVQLTHREQLWGPAVKGLFGLGVALSLGLGYRKWERDRAARADSPAVEQADVRRPPGRDPLHAITLAVLIAFLLGAAVAYFLFWPSSSSKQPAPSTGTKRTADPALWERCMEEHCEGEMWAGGECQHTADEGVDLDEWCREEWAATRRCSKQHCAKFDSDATSP